MVAYGNPKLPGLTQSSVITGNLMNLTLRDPTTDRGASELVSWSVKLPGVERTHRFQMDMR